MENFLPDEVLSQINQISDSNFYFKSLKALLNLSSSAQVDLANFPCMHIVIKFL